MKGEKSLSHSALEAMQRAAQIARKKAAEKNLKIPVWKDGRIIYEVPKKDPSHNLKAK